MSDMTATITPKSDQMNADDLIAGPRTITVTRVTVNPGAEQPVDVFFEGDGGKPFRPGKSMRRVLVAVWGPDPSAYAGRSMTLYRDPEVTWAGMAVGGIRISHMSHMDGPVVLALTATKKARKPFRVEPLVVEKPATAATQPPRRTLSQFLDALEVELREAPTWEAVSTIASRQDVIRAQEVARAAQAERLSDMLDAARERTNYVEPEVAE
jgi:hypothetical protein